MLTSRSFFAPCSTRWARSAPWYDAMPDGSDWATAWIAPRAKTAAASRTQKFQGFIAPPSGPPGAKAFDPVDGREFRPCTGLSGRGKETARERAPGPLYDQPLERVAYAHRRLRDVRTRADVVRRGVVEHRGRAVGQPGVDREHARALGQVQHRAQVELAALEAVGEAPAAAVQRAVALVRLRVA